MKYSVKIFQDTSKMEAWLNDNKDNLADFKIAMSDNYLLVVAQFNL